MVKSMDAVMRSMNLEKMSQMLSKFESQFEDLDVRTAYMDQAMGNTTTTSMPEVGPYPGGDIQRGPTPYCRLSPMAP